ncbi:hypothetical protein MVLG_04072 [Microbotryum lychnidis-dioicae p1A1 Lamole]|uniref:pectinesterase n=1 Tax=Microbotryum lychnidis-dioicae (strain p1A1 Lamole / MvSl-1064) TaxID=683840 RepID=U5HA37_USTV1|nr:hypothetical protein MVLG_04072 [Microbotryum lychnidis-dioicae p1A1 Lamole]|eukprot:KDE05577.1 hypothetical protein MVLG_04072 [Microbotryum lychnidis-dioicae p1A1 Lamole]
MLLPVAPFSSALLLFTNAALSLLPSIAAKHPNDKRLACQGFTKCFEPKNCPPGTLYVSRTDSNAHFKTISAAIASLPSDTSAKTIVVGAGHYQEQLNVTRKGPLYLYGQTGGSTTNQVTAFFSKGTTQVSVGGVFQSSNIDNGATAVLSVAPSYNASLTGAGYTGDPLITDTSQSGCSDFRMYNMDLDQEWGPVNTGPALAVSVSYANASFYGVGVFGYQDTVYAGHNASVLFLDSDIRGATDFLYGFGSLWIESSTLGSRGAGGGIVAWKGSVQPAGNLYGALVTKRSARAQRIAPDLNATLNITHKVALGRPWNNASRTIYLDTYMDDHILPAGFIEWSATDPRLNFTLFYAEYNSSGPGFNATARAALTAGTPLTAPATDAQHIEHILTAPQANMSSFSKVFGSNLGWVDFFYDDGSFAASVGDRQHRSHGHKRDSHTRKVKGSRRVLF